MAPQMRRDADPIGVIALEMVELMAPDGSHTIC